MASTHLWYQFGLYRAKIGACGLFLLLWVSILPAAAQPRPFKKNLPNHDARLMHYGMHFGLHTSRYEIQHSNYFIQRQLDSTKYTVNPKFGPGFNIGFIVNRKLTDFIDLRFVPGFVFTSSTVEFKPDGGEALNRELATTTFDVPLLFRLKSLRRGNTRMYFVAGAKTSIDFGNKINPRTSPDLEINSQDLAIQYGVGMDLFYPFFKFSPEIRFSNGITNRYAPGPNAQSKSVQSLRSNSVTLYFNIEN